MRKALWFADQVADDRRTPRESGGDIPAYHPRCAESAAWAITCKGMKNSLGLTGKKIYIATDLIAN